MIRPFSDRPDLLAITPTGHWAKLVPQFGLMVQICWQEPIDELSANVGKQWLLNEGFIALAHDQITLDPQVTQFLETI